MIVYSQFMKRSVLLYGLCFMVSLYLHAEDSIMYNYDAIIPSYVSFEIGDLVEYVIVYK